MARNIVPFTPPSAAEHTNAETERKNKQFAWAECVLHQVGLADRITHAATLNELRQIVFDGDDLEITLAINDALNPAAGKRAEYLKGLKAGALKRLLKNRFDAMWDDREKQILSGRGGRPGQGGGPQTAPPPDWLDDIIRDKKGNIIPFLANYILFLVNHPEWRGVLAFDQFANTVKLLRPPPWEKLKPGKQWTVRRLTDSDETRVRRWFQIEGLKAPLGDIGRGVQDAAQHNQFNPALDWFEAQQWDGTHRAATWLVKYWHAKDSDYIRAIGPRILIAVVARVYEPGCEVHQVPIFEGRQNLGKTKGVKKMALRKEWYLGRLSPLGGDRAIMEQEGKLIIEDQELQAIGYSPTATSKNYITRSEDDYVPPWGTHSIQVPRQSSLWATKNPPAGGRYLKDETGNRRYWPILCLNKIDLVGLERDAPQLYAEAVHLFKQHMPWWLETDELEALATAEQELRMWGDPYERPIKEYVGRNKNVEVAEILEALSKGTTKETNPFLQSDQDRIVKILKKLGAKLWVPKVGGKRRKHYRLEET
jgi:putative DNA primase/helicase